MPKATPLSSTELDLLARAALHNAVELLADAKTLFDARRWPRAYALAVLSGEEFGKFESCRTAAGYDSDDHDAWTKFWEDFKAHKPKFTSLARKLIASMDSWPPGAYRNEQMLEAWKRASEGRHRMAKAGIDGKMAALYVDYVDGKLSIPSKVVDMHVALNMVNAVTRVVEQAAANISTE
ncbi:MAG TPA: AbiV family abortive infection protein [Mycobacteriales bacterium]|nr:AbiV family abortive infection protein [Mycobacteriales bacterium]